MRQHAIWSIFLFRWGGVHVRIHMFFLLFAAFTLFLAGVSDQSNDQFTWLVAGTTIGILFVSVLVHELGHCFVSLHLGGDAPLLILGPLGGLYPPATLAEPRREFIVHLAGPLVNLGMCATAAVILLARQGTDWFGILHPLSPQGLLDGGRLSFLGMVKIGFWINWVLFLVNLLPAFPFDGGRALRAGLLAFNPEIMPRHAGFLVATIAKFTAFVLLILAIIWWKDTSASVVPVWFSLVLLALFLYFSAKQEEERPDDPESDEETFGYDFSQGFTSLERSGQGQQDSVSPFRRWLEERRQARVQRQREVEAEEEGRVDEILTRLHEQGMESLSAEDRLLLKRVSQRLRSRPSNNG